MKNIHIVPTDKPSRLVKIKDNLFYTTTENIPGCVYQHIHITNNEVIKEGDWFYNEPTNYVGKILKKEGKFWVCENMGGFHLLSMAKKIILTTDTRLIQDGVQAIGDEFLEWFVKNPSCESLEVQKTFVTNSGLGYQEYATLDSNFKVIEINAKIPQTSYYLGKVTILNTYEYVINYKIIIPKEEPNYNMKQDIFAEMERLEREPKQEWNPTQGEEVWIKVFSNWSKGTYIGYDVTKQTHIVREDEKGGGNLFSSTEVLPYYAMPNDSKQEHLTYTESAKRKKEYLILG